LFPLNDPSFTRGKLLISSNGEHRIVSFDALATYDRSQLAVDQTGDSLAHRQAEHLAVPPPCRPGRIRHRN
jgi:hypothetical protein